MSANELDELSPKLQQCLHQIGQFIAQYETHSGQVESDRVQTQSLLSEFKKQTDKQLLNIKHALKEIEEVMSAAGAARWRVNAERALEEGRNHLSAIEKVKDDFTQLSFDTISQLRQMIIEMEKNIADILTTLVAEQNEVTQGLKKRAEDSYNQLEHTISKTQRKIKSLRKWLFWDRLFVASFAAIAAAFLMHMYVAAEWPWETKQSVIAERKAGQALLNAWPKLSPEERLKMEKILGIKP